MTAKLSGARIFSRAAAVTLTLAGLGAGFGPSAQADQGQFPHPGGGPSLMPGNLLVSRSVYENAPSLTAGVSQLPTGCVSGCVTATAAGAYPECGTTS